MEKFNKSAVQEAVIVEDYLATGRNVRTTIAVITGVFGAYSGYVAAVARSATPVGAIVSAASLAITFATSSYGTSMLIEEYTNKASIKRFVEKFPREMSALFRKEAGTGETIDGTAEPEVA